MRGIYEGREAKVRAQTTLCALLVSACAACNVTNTGNPNTGDGAPEGMELVRSKLQRETHPTLSDADRATFGSDSRQFAFDLYAQLKDGSPNLFYSPYSISVALAMTYAGARGETEHEMASALRFGLPQASLHQAFNATDLALQGRAQELPELGSGDGFALRVTNGSFLQKGRSFQAPYLDVLAQQYDAGLYLVDFAADPERERVAINQWVLDRAEQRISELLPQGSIQPDVPLVLVNAIYFKASWFEKFDPTQTAPGTFHAPGGDVQVQMMHHFFYQYARGDGYQAVELSYISSAVRMLFILPDEGQLASLEAKLNRDWFDQVRQTVSSSNALVNLSVPRFRFDSEIQLRDALQTLGMQRAFVGGGADFSGISGPPGELYIDQVYHKAFVAVDEQGTEAAASTAVVPRAVSVQTPVVLALDRPFLFAIYDEPTGQILFMGRLNQPSE